MNDFINMFLFNVKNFMHEEGVYPQQGLVRKEENNLEVIALAVNSNEVADYFVKIAANPLVEEYIFGIDLLSADVDDFKTESFLLIVHATRENFRVGVMQYEYIDGKAKAYQIDWAHPFYSQNVHRYTHFAGLGYEGFIEKFSLSGKTGGEKDGHS